jgi:hypothetical protein
VRRRRRKRPRAIICHTVKGKGIRWRRTTELASKSDLSEKDLLAIRGALGS